MRPAAEGSRFLPPFDGFRPALRRLSRRPALVGTLAAAAGTLAFFWPLLLGFTFSTVAGHQRWVYPWFSPDSPYDDANQSDQATLSYPWQAFLSRSLRAGDLPLWNPLSFGGQPFLSNGSSAVMYPPKVLGALLFSPSVAHDFFCVLHVFCAGLAMFLLCRELGARTEGSLLGATSWMFASFNMAWLHLEVVTPVIALLPLSLFLVRRAVRAGSLGSVLGAAFVTGATLVSGHLLLVGAVWAVAVSYGLGSLLGVVLATPAGTRARAVARSGSRLLAVALGGLALSACVLLPTAATIRSSQRRPLSYEHVRERARSEPRVLLNVFRPPPVPARLDGGPMNKEMTFVGTAAGVLALIGLFRRGGAPALGRVLAIGVALLVLDTPVLRLAYLLVPGFTLLLPLGRLFFIWDLGIALLAAAGLDAVAATTAAFREKWSGNSTAWRRRLGGVEMEKVMVAAVVIANSIQLIRYGRAVNPPFHPRTPELLYPRTPLITAARTHVRRSRGRVVAVESWRGLAPSPACLVAGQHMVFGLPSLGGYDSVIPSRALHVSLVSSGARTVEQVLQDPPMGAYRPQFRVDTTRFELLPRLGVTAIVGPRWTDRSPDWLRSQTLHPERIYGGRDGQVFGIPGAAGEAWVAAGALLVESPADALCRLADPEFDFRREVILLRSDAPWATPPRGPVTMAAGDHARIERKTNNRLTVRVQSTGGGWLVVADTWDSGWRATLDGQPADLFQANYAFRAVRVPGGEHRVEMHYMPTGFVPGLWISGTALLAAAVAVAARRRITHCFILTA